MAMAMSPGKKLLKWRTKDGRTQAACGEAVGASQATWSEWEQEKKLPGIGFAFAIEDLTGGYIKAREWADAERAA